jgi:outer membrane biosynthesis protein TonB
MGRLTASLLVFSLAAVLAVALSACGGSDAELLPGRTASEIESNLDEVARLAAEKECIGAEDAAQEVSSEVAALGDVDAKLKQALSEGASRLSEVVASCEEEPAEEEVETFEPEEEIETAEKAAKPKKAEKEEKSEKPEKEEAETEAPEEEGSPSLPPQANGKGKGLENGEGPSEGGAPPSGGVGPGTPVEGE